MRKFRSNFDSHYMITTPHGNVVFNEYLAEADGTVADDLAKAPNVVEVTAKSSPAEAPSAPKPAPKK